MANSLQELQGLGQSVWFDNIRRGFINSGELERLIDLGVSGLTSNPSIFEKAITGSADYDEALLGLALNGSDAVEIFERLAMEDIQAAADLLRPIYERTAGGDGFASIEVSPHLANDTDGTVSEARRLHAALQRPNVMIKVPATPAGIPAIRALIGEGINVNVTLIFSLGAYAQVREAYIGGLEDLAQAGGNPAGVASVASFFVSRVDGMIDGQLEGRIGEGASELEALMGKAAVANAKIAYRDFKQTFASDRFAALQGRGGRVQRPLWASTSTKNPEYSDVLYVDSLIGPDTVNTLPDVTLTAFLEHGNPVGGTIERDLDDAVRTIEALEDAGISMRGVTDALLADGVKAFADSFDALIANIEDKRARLMASGGAAASAALGDCDAEVDAALARLQSEDVVGRIWERDHTVWKPDPTEISDRLGWLTVGEDMRGRVAELQAFADEVRGEGFEHMVVLGMGGSSLGAEALGQIFGSAAGYPKLRVLDSTVPANVKATTDAIDCAKALFVVASKSGTTIEPNMFYKHFRALTEKAVGADAAGGHFVAICDGGTALERLAGEHGFRRVFVNPSDIGGRYSVQSLFGLVPAALAGIDIGALLERVNAMGGACAETAARDNPGAWLGAVMGALAAKGRDKLTLVTTPSLSSLGLWLEQLLAESTGKEGKGVMPIAGSPMGALDGVGDDRLFVYLRLNGDDAADTDAYMDRVEAAGMPSVRLRLNDRHDVGGEFFRWEFATATAGALLGINPFDQPDVQGAKDITTELIADYTASGAAPSAAPLLESVGSLWGLLGKAEPGDYLAITAYLEQTPELDAALDDLRRYVGERWGVATTLGYGPRYLHSTGQIHKGGPNTGLHLQLTQRRNADVAIPGEPFTFGVLADAQAKGDLDALAAQGRRVARAALWDDGVSDIRAIEAGLRYGFRSG